MGRDGRFLKGLAVFLGTRDYPTPEPSPLGIYDYGCAHLLRTSDGMVLIRVTGEIDVSTAPQLAAAVHHALQRTRLQFTLTWLKCCSSVPQGQPYCFVPNAPVSEGGQTLYCSGPRAQPCGY